MTKTVLATVAGTAARRGLLPGLDEPLDAVLPALRDTPSAGQTWRHLLTMTRGAAVSGRTCCRSCADQPPPVQAARPAAFTGAPRTSGA